MVVISGGQRNFREMETLGWGQYCFSNELFGFPSHKKVRLSVRVLVSVSSLSHTIDQIFSYKVLLGCQVKFLSFQ